MPAFVIYSTFVARSLERGSEMAANGPRSLPDKAEVAQHGPNMAPRLLKIAHERPQISPRWAQRPEIPPQQTESQFALGLNQTQSKFCFRFDVLWERMPCLGMTTPSIDANSAFGDTVR